MTFIHLITPNQLYLTFWVFVHFSGMADGKMFKLCRPTQAGISSVRRGMKTTAPPSGRGQGHVTHFFGFANLIISLKQVKLA